MTFGTHRAAETWLVEAGYRPVGDLYVRTTATDGDTPHSSVSCATITSHTVAPQWGGDTYYEVRFK